jgi:CubicO group peptidase (beta-lactamase class C family)
MQRMTRQLFLTIALALTLSLASAAQTKTTDSDLQAKVDAQLEALVKAGKFSGSVLIARDGRVLMSKGYGMANIEDETPNTPQTKFRLGSITKQFTATAIMMLQEQGKLNVQDSICKYVTDCPAAWQPVTLHHLLSHTGGIPNFTSFPDYYKTMTQPTTVDALVARFKDKPLDFQPGEKWDYSNSGYVLLGQVIEKVSGKTYEAFLQDNIFTPLGMANTGYDHAAKILPHRAAGYEPRGEGLANATYLDMSIPFSAGGLYSTVEDLYLWDQALYTEKLISRKSLDAMFTPVKNNYGYGWGINNLDGLKWIAHSGGINGFLTFIMRSPDAKALVVVLCNNMRSKPDEVSKNLAKLAFADKMTAPADKKAAAAKHE